MDLQSGKLYWPAVYPDAPAFPTLEEDLTCDVLIVGAGSTGAQCAYEFIGSGLKVAVVDKRRAGHGSTLSSTGLLQFLGDKMLFELVNTFGESAAVRHTKLCEQAISGIEAAARKLPLDAEFVRRASLYCASIPEDVAKLQKEYDLLQRHGFNVHWRDSGQIAKAYSFRRPAALYMPNDGEINPYKYTYGLLRFAQENGFGIYENTELTGRTDEKDWAVFRTANGRTIRARHAVMATGYETMELKKDNNAFLLSTYAVVTRPVADFFGWHNRTLIWETARPYVYMRTTPDNRIIVGGLDEGTAIAEERDARLLRKKELLVQELRTRFPNIRIEAEYYLAAFFAGTHDGLPMIGEYEQIPRCLFLYAYGDNGLVYGSVLAKLIRDRLTGGGKGDYELYRQGRQAPASV